MCLFQYDDDPEPEEPGPAGLLYVPVRPGTHAVAVRVFRTPLGSRTAVGFTTVARLAATLGAEQPRIRLSESVLRSLAEPLGAELLTVDPTLTAPAVTSPAASAPASRKGPAAQEVGQTAPTA
ncbi:SAV_915 family protein [Streptomyces exfoliatus]|uniref:SAV_915 family protein n=1 Tax=Streptomyces exfoliatus TaxID=1905 RepID=UPI00046729F7|nr:SAV_915 family protein [Streptomyces exfoliatus]